MLLEFLGAAREVTGSCHYVMFDDVHLLVDCGMEQGPDLYENQELPVNAAEIDYVFVTHAHVDHSGLLPLLYKNGFRGWIYATKATMDLCSIMLRDSAHIQVSEAEWKNRKARRAGQPEVTPMYDANDVQGVMGQFVPCDYGEKFEVCKGLEVRFVDAGHLLGSASIEMWITEEGQQRKLVFSGDIGSGNRPMIKDPTYIEEADYVIMESTYGNRNHDSASVQSRVKKDDAAGRDAAGVGEAERGSNAVIDEADYVKQQAAASVDPGFDYATELARVINATFSKGGNLVIPAFSVGRTQELLYFIRRIKTEGLLPEYPGFEVYMDSPLAVEATSIFTANRMECYNEKDLELINHGINPIRFPGLKVAVTSDESRKINTMEQPKVIISASGMCEAGRIRHHLKHNLWRADSTILFVGYQVPGTLGSSLLGGAKTVRIFGEEIEVHADIVRLPGLSAHADRDHLTRWVEAFKKPPKKVFVVHGEEPVAVEFAEHVINDVGIEAVAPYSGDIYDLISGACVQNGTHKKAEKKRKDTGKGSGRNTVYDRLLAAGERLIAIIRKNKGLANKDAARFADQITALCDKWDR
ncbi:MAG: MBL fold metallo-hydrolase [Clostridiales bacterium]|nr:MBL fold metallo-hydrolase [Clostridiales bacterium]